MKKIILLSFYLLAGIISSYAQTIISLPDIKPVDEVKHVFDQSVYSDKATDAHIIWAAPGFKKARNGAPVREQLFILEGKIRFTLSGKTQELTSGHWVILPANTPHTIEVMGDKQVKLLAIQDKTSS